MENADKKTTKTIYKNLGKIDPSSLAKKEPRVVVLLLTVLLFKQVSITVEKFH